MPFSIVVLSTSCEKLELKSFQKWKETFFLKQTKKGSKMHRKK